MKLFIPPLGSKVKLKKDWTFALYEENRNEALLARVNNRVEEPAYTNWEAHFAWSEAKHHYSFTLPKETVLVIDRIYIRKGQDDFDSITFLIQDCPDKELVGWNSTQRDEKKIFHRKSRFWAKLDDVNKLDVTIVNK